MTPGWRTDFLTQMGFAVADTVDTADVLIWCTESDEDQAVLLADPAVAKLGNREAQHLHRQGTRRRDRVRVAPVLPAGGRSAAAAHRAGTGLTT